MEPLLQCVGAVTVPVPGPGRGLASCRDVPGRLLAWRGGAAGQAGLRAPGSGAEAVLATRQGYGLGWKAASAGAAAGVLAANGGTVPAGPADTPAGRLAVAEDPFGSRLVPLDPAKGTCDTDDSGAAAGVW